MTNKNRIALIVGILCVLVFSFAFSGCTTDSTARRLERKGYVTKVDVSKKNTAIEHSISKRIHAYNTSTGDHVLISDYKTKEMAKEFYNKNKGAITNANMRMVIRGKRVAYGTKGALKALGYIKK